MKSFYFLFIVLVYAMFLALNLNYNYSVDLNKLTFYNLPCGMQMSFLLSWDNLFFFIMVSLVSMFVSVFSEMYLEFYNIKKYFILFYLFYFSMNILIFSSSAMTLTMGWDYLGLSSIFLIMFYPNNMNMKNSILTMFFNRLGDLFMMFSFILMIQSSNLFYFFWHSKYSWVLLVCIFTKSAQFPFSMWLPLAMSAPTPISAMVHSSTLVTAGIFLINKFYDMNTHLIFLSILTVISSLSFFLGGLLASLENDYKKIIAFSTLSQISMMILFLSNGFMLICFFHMFMHALFKSMLFSCTGMIFFNNFMDQNKFNVNSYSKSFNFIKIFMIFLVYMMTGLLFSMSFFSKDLFIELNFSTFGNLSMFFTIMGGSILTMSYCGVLVKNLSKNFNLKLYKYSKSTKYFFWIYILMYFLNIIFSNLKFNMESFINSLDLALCLVLLTSMTLFYTISYNMSSKNLNYAYFQSFTTVFYLKLNIIYLKYFMKFHYSDSLLYNKFYFMNIFAFNFTKLTGNFMVILTLM